MVSVFQYKKVLRVGGKEEERQINEAADFCFHCMAASSAIPSREFLLSLVSKLHKSTKISISKKAARVY